MIRRLTILLFVLLIFSLLPSCAGLGMLDDKSFSMSMKGLNVFNRMIIKKMLKTIEDCKEKCKTNKEHSDEWCNCMDECYRLTYDSPDENVNFCLPDSTNTTPSDTNNFT